MSEWHNKVTWAVTWRKGKPMPICEAILQLETTEFDRPEVEFVALLDTHLAGIRSKILTAYHTKGGNPGPKQA